MNKCQIPFVTGACGCRKLKQGKVPGPTKDDVLMFNFMLMAGYKSKSTIFNPLCISGG